mgnify:CR=1 FL=1
MTVQITSFSPGKLISRLETLLKTNLVVDLLAQPPLPNASFRSYRTHAISVIDVRGAAIDIRKSTARSTDVHLLRLLRGSVQLVHADGCTTVSAGQFVAYRGPHAVQFRHERGAELPGFLGVEGPARSVEQG